MKRIALLPVLITTVGIGIAVCQTPTTPAKPAAKPGTAAHTATRTGTAATSAVKLPPGVPPVRGVVKSAFALRYQDVKIGTGALAEPNKLYQVHYTGWLASDGKKFDSSFDHRQPVMDKDGKPENDADGKPKLGEAQPFTFPQGRGRVIPGWDQGFEGMKIGGKRRLFIPYQLAYGAMGRPPVIPAKSDLIFDIELVGVQDMPAQGMPPGGRPMPRPGSHPVPAPGAPGSPAPATPPPAGTAAPTSPTPTSPIGQPTPPAPAAPAKPGDPTAPTVAPNSAPAPSAPATPSTPPPTAPADKPANPAPTR